MKVKEKQILSILAVYAFACLMIGSLYDLKINQALYMRGSIFPNFFKFTGELPMIIILATSAYLYIRYALIKKNYVMLTLMLVVTVGFPLGSSFTTLGYFNKSSLLLSMLIFAFYMTTVFIIGKNFMYYNSQRVIRYSLFAVSSIILIFLAFTILKDIWGRTRFFPMYQENDFTMFTNWWQITGNSGDDIFKSFPSGHSGAAASTLVLIYLPRVFKKNAFIQRYRNFFIFGPIVWTVLVQISRILDGAHYLTDVSFSLLLATGIIYLMSRVFLGTYVE